jgi:hypothetical protein
VCLTSGIQRRYARARGAARHGALPPVQVADRKLEGVTCIRLDATVVTAHSDKKLAEANSRATAIIRCWRAAAIPARQIRRARPGA